MQIPHRAWMTAKDGRQPGSVDECARHFGKVKPETVAVIAGDKQMTWRELNAKADKLASAFVKAGLKPGDRVGWLAKNRLEWVVLLLACRRARLAIVGFNYRLAPPEIAYIVSDCEPTIILADEALASLLSASNLDKVKVVKFGAEFDALMATGDDAFTPLKPDRDDLVFIFYTSGTSGKPKGVMHVLGKCEDSIALTVPFDFNEKSVMLIAVPLIHMAAAVWVEYGMTFGMTHVLMADPTPAGIVDAFEKYRVTETVMVPTLIALALAEQKKHRRDTSSLKMICYGGAPIPPSLLRESVEGFGCNFAQAYGMSETHMCSFYLDPEDHVTEGPHIDRLKSAGRLNHGCDFRIENPETREILGPHQVGEVVIKSPWIMGGYWRLPEKTAEVLSADGWYKTGDAGYYDEDGFLYLTDRIHDMIVTGAENVYPTEVEAVLATHPGVQDVSVFGVPHPVWGEEVRAALVARPGHDLDPAEVIAYCRTQLAHYKCPKSAVVMKELPRNTGGKVLRRELKAQAVQA